ncbi:hypothetical protein FD430_07055 [Salmonella enterica]|uniref:Uncharacterized protein n=1 Tax=Salmonella diarizonae TaxID=59204 RepID=A0A702D5F6_SALDZ|nr:hypothetical protein [Salmonella enterica]EAW2473870.1 hypothetical protein [Salmonella enterica subsp. enterica]EBP3743527.1 hypothetical protein [Salmonella enterica subsp. arizonae]ECC9721244.1 hypothetical protein [Salmonella enterica subsp. diarizonae]ECS6771749.1 hypothetical protein [Salmonella enterica subsp. diarizonae serovar 65:z10:e,n,x,z15]EDT8253735.1 hypothetical protein [Salmonella enterica subsp. diarizonae serovar 48:z52:z]
MFKQAEKSKQDKRKAISDSFIQNKQFGKHSVVIVDNRAETTTQRMPDPSARKNYSELNVPMTESKTMSHMNGCGCPSCAGAAQLKINLSAQSASLINRSDRSTEVKQLCQHNHPEHADKDVCPYGLSDASFRAPPKHIKGHTGGPAKKRKRGRRNVPPSVASESVMTHAERELSAGRAQVVNPSANGGNDIEVAVKRQHHHKSGSAETRTFYIHKGSNPVGGGRKAHDFFIKDGEPSESDSSDSDVEEKKESE